MSTETTIPDAAQAQDPRIGRTFRVKSKMHRHYWNRGLCRAILPSGTAQINCKDGVLALELACGEIVLEPADEWVTV